MSLVQLSLFRRTSRHKNDLNFTSLTFNGAFKHHVCRVWKYKLTFSMMRGGYKDTALSRLYDVIDDAEDNSDRWCHGCDGLDSYRFMIKLHSHPGTHRDRKNEIKSNGEKTPTRIFSKWIYRHSILHSQETKANERKCVGQVFFEGSGNLPGPERRSLKGCEIWWWGQGGGADSGQQNQTDPKHTQLLVLPRTSTSSLCLLSL